MYDLAERFRHYGSDKDRNGYSPIYHLLGEVFLRDTFTLVEIGIGTMLPGACSSMNGIVPDTYQPGASLRAWRDYFAYADIIGVDVQPDTQFTEDRIRTLQFDAGNPAELEEHFTPLLASDLKPLRFIVDDGNHHPDAQRATLRNFFPLLELGGVYVIEDIYPGSDLHADPDSIRAIVGDHPFFFVGLKSNQCVIHKRPLQTLRERHAY